MYSLRDNQKEAIRWCLAHKHSLIEGGTSIGKTYLSIWMIKKQPNKKFIVLVHKKSMVKQWENEQIKIFGNLLDNVDVYPYSSNLPNNLKCDFLIVDEAHKIKGMGVQFKRVRRVKKQQIILLTATPVNTDEDWYMYFNLFGLITSKEKFFNYFEAYGYDAKKPYIRYNVYGGYRKDKFFKMSGLNDTKLENTLDKFRIQINPNILDIKNFNLIKLPELKIPQKLTYVEKREYIHSNQKHLKIKHIDKKSIIIINNDFEKNWLLDNLPNSTTNYEEFKNGYDYWIANYRVGEMTGTDGIQHHTNKMVFWSSVPSTAQMIQIVGRISGKREIKKPIFKLFVGNSLEREQWIKTFKLKNKGE